MSYQTAFEKNSDHTATYEEAIRFYQKLEKGHPQLQLRQYGTTDSGHPLHLAVISKDLDFDVHSIRKKGKCILLVNNAIHPGEPCGVDASMMLARDLLVDKSKQAVLDNCVLLIIPFYNIGGGLNRNSHSRTNQNGPKAYGFRGNARNLDLNRDFVKCDSRNARTFNQIYGEWQPDVFIDNHTSNGADYQYTMTLIPTQHNKLTAPMADFMQQQMLPALYENMEKKNWEMTPYVYARDTPDGGIAGFLDLARYSSGYASLFNTISFMPETHMLKPFKDRVNSTRAFMESMLHFLQDKHRDLLTARDQANTYVATQQQQFDLNWELDPSQKDSVLFKGYEAKYKPSEVSGLDRLYYDRSMPYEKHIPFFNTYKATLTIEKPMAYIIPQAYVDLIDRLKWNGVKMKRLQADVAVDVELYRIADFKTTDTPYEGHYLHSKIEVEKTNGTWRYRKGDYLIHTDQPSNRYIIETLEPQAPDSWFAWNFFDGILMQKEYFSSYVFEDLAAGYLKEDPKLREQLEAAKKADPEMAKSAYAQLNFIYRHSPHYEPTHRLYPVGRVMNKAALPVAD